MSDGDLDVPGGFSEREREAMRQRAAEMRAQRGGRKRVEDLQAALDAIAAMDDGDRRIAERIHAIVHRVAPELRARTWYGFPAYAGSSGVVCFYTSAEKGGSRYGVLGFNDAARLDDGVMWPTTYAITAWTDEVAARVEELVARATDSDDAQ